MPKAHNVSYIAELDISRIAPLDAPHHDIGAAFASLMAEQRDEKKAEAFLARIRALPTSTADGMREAAEAAVAARARARAAA